MVAGGTGAAGRAERDRLFRTLWDHLVTRTPDPRGDVLFCFGSRHAGVPRRAAELHHAGAAPWILVTGGGPSPTGTSEAGWFAEALVAHGVAPERIVADHQARHTGENVRFGMDRLADAGLAPQRAVLVSWPLSARRCLATFTRHHPEVRVDSAPAGPPPGLCWPARSRAVRAALGEYERLQRYADLGYLHPQPRPGEVVDAACRLRALVEGAGEPERPLVHLPFQPVLERG